MVRAIGGYFGIELSFKGEYYPDAMRMMSGRSSMEFILKSRRIKRLLVPRYLPVAMGDPASAHGVHLKYYDLDRNLAPIIENNDHDAVLLVNYFGILNETIRSISEMRDSTVILDRSQAFFDRPDPGIDSFNSTRKFFGVSDGSYLFTDVNSNIPDNKGISWDRSSFLLKRLDLSPEDAYEDYLRSESKLKGIGIIGMSDLTRAILASIDYEQVRARRTSNFRYLHDRLAGNNSLSDVIDGNPIDGPMVYPYLTDDRTLRQRLIRERVFVATYWNEMLGDVEFDSIENELKERMVPLIIDQRYDREDMDRIIEVIGRGGGRDV